MEWVNNCAQQQNFGFLQCGTMNRKLQQECTWSSCAQQRSGFQEALPAMRGKLEQAQSTTKRGCASVPNIFSTISTAASSSGLWTLCENLWKQTVGAEFLTLTTV